MAIGSHGQPLREERRWLPPRWVFYGGLFVVLVIVWNTPSGDERPWPTWPEMQTTRTLVLAMFQYANDNNAYPDGKSSTEVFQKLLDGNYISDPAIFYVPMPGKTKCLVGSRLQPQNVCFDVTSGIQMNSPDDLPVVFLTGFRIAYSPGGTTVSLVRPFPGIHHGSTSWWQSINGGGPFEPVLGLPVAYMSNNAYFRSAFVQGPGLRYTSDGYGIVPDVVASTFNAKGQTYRQLTPEGVLK
jgi:hypothetical protein